VDSTRTFLRRCCVCDRPTRPDYGMDPLSLAAMAGQAKIRLRSHLLSEALAHCKRGALDGQCPRQFGSRGCCSPTRAQALSSASGSAYPKESFAQITRRMLGAKGFPKRKTRSHSKGNAGMHLILGGPLDVAISRRKLYSVLHAIPASELYQSSFIYGIAVGFLPGFFSDYFLDRIRVRTHQTEGTLQGYF
jgi:hypothetical protein